MKMLDPVKVLVEKDGYAKEGVHKGMYGWICDDSVMDGCWLVNFPQYGEKARFDALEKKSEPTPPEDLSSYLV